MEIARSPHSRKSSIEAAISAYLDSSVYVSLYFRDAHVRRAKRWVTESTRPLLLTPLNRVEFEHALAQYVYRKVFSTEESAAIAHAFEVDRQKGLWEIAPFPSSAFDGAMRLARRFVTKIGGRTLDSLHVAAALELSAEAFWTFDSRQATLAKKAGLKVKTITK